MGGIASPFAHADGLLMYIVFSSFMYLYLSYVFYFIFSLLCFHIGVSLFSFYVYMVTLDFYKTFLTRNCFVRYSPAQNSGKRCACPCQVVFLLVISEGRDLVNQRDCRAIC